MKKPKKLTVAILRSLKRQLIQACEDSTLRINNFVCPKGEMNPKVCLTVGGVVYLDGIGYMHPHAFRDVFGEEMYNELLSRPRIVCEYDEDSK